MEAVQTTARTLHERLRVTAMIDATIAAVLGLSMRDMRHILAECDHTIGAPRRQPKGFWRVDKDKPPELRQTVLTLLAFEALHQHGDGDSSRSMASFLTHHPDGWLVPETARLADHGLGHDNRASHRRLVASGLGPRFYRLEDRPTRR